MEFLQEYYTLQRQAEKAIIDIIRKKGEQCEFISNALSMEIEDNYAFILKNVNSTKFREHLTIYWNGNVEYNVWSGVVEPEEIFEWIDDNQ